MKFTSLVNIVRDQNEKQVFLNVSMGARSRKKKVTNGTSMKMARTQPKSMIIYEARLMRLSNQILIFLGSVGLSCGGSILPLY